jgi:hypothetical protein
MDALYLHARIEGHRTAHASSPWVTRDGAQYGAFDRKAGSFCEALASAIGDVTSAVTGLQVVRVEPDELVTLAAIAERSGLSREYIRLLSANKRGPEDSPPPSHMQTTRLAYGTGPTSPIGSPSTRRPR